LGKEVREQVLTEYRGKILPPDHAITQFVEQIVSRILESNNLGIVKSQHSEFVQDGDAIWTSGESSSMQDEDGKQKEWQVYVIHDENKVNAFASLGGCPESVIFLFEFIFWISGNLVVVFTGLFPLAQDEQGLAAVLAHG
jgi:predicted Zn-dependent protease